MHARPWQRQAKPADQDRRISYPCVPRPLTTHCPSCIKELIEKAMRHQPFAEQHHFDHAATPTRRSGAVSHGPHLVNGSIRSLPSRRDEWVHP